MAPFAVLAEGVFPLGGNAATKDRCFVVHIHFKQSMAASLLVAAAMAISACGNVSRGVSNDGQHADTLVWPAVSDAPSMHKGGTFPNMDHLRLVRAGLDKRQIANLIGFPHFSEGVWGVREWNYVFNFQETDGDAVTTCQFKILFDKDKLAHSFYWHPESCAPFQQPQASRAPVPTAAPKNERLTLSSDALFAFDGASIADLTSDGRAALDEVVNTIKNHQGGVRRIRIAGYTDRLGDEAYNDDLSRKRAFAVMDYLVANGISSGLIQAAGRGKAGPVKDCPPSSRGSLITCLAPNRRVEVVISADGMEASADGGSQ